MVQAADHWPGNDGTALGRVNFSRYGRVVVERLMRAGRVVVSEVFCEDALEMCLVQHDDVVEAFSPNRADQPFDVGILPGRVGRDRYFFGSK